MKTLSPRAGISSQPLHTSAPASHTGLVSNAVTIPFLLLVAALVLFSGCATTSSPIDRAAKMLASTVATVDSAMTIYAEAVALDLVAAADIERVDKLYADYQAAESVVESALINALQTRDAGGLAAATSALTATKLELLKFLARFTTSPPTK